MDVDLSNYLIEGIGNEVTYTLLVTVSIVAVVTSFAYFWSVHGSRSGNIHPSSQESVDNVRHRLNGNTSNRVQTEFNNEDSISASPGREGEVSNGAGNSPTNGVHSPPLHRYGMDNHCPVCLNEPNYPIETNCGHLFCAQCIIVYWRHGSWRGAVPCPVCRQSVSVLLRSFTSGIGTEEERRIAHEINDYNRRYSGEPRPWLDYVWDLPTLLRHLSSEFFTVGGLMYMFRIRIVICFVAAIMYLISPLDMIPEAVFGLLGLLDDIFVVVLLAIYVTIIYRRFLAHRWQDETNL